MSSIKSIIKLRKLGQIGGYIKVLYKIYKFGQLVRHKDSFLPYNSKFAGNLRSNRNFYKISWIGSKRGI